jgi:uncharacterized protein
MNAYEATRLFAKTLENIQKWMDKAEEHAKDRGFEVDVLAQSRLAPDQYTLVRQIQTACDQAKFAAAYLSGGKAPSHPDTEQTIADLRLRIEKVTKYLSTVPEKDFAGADDQKVSPAWMGGRWVRGRDYLVELAIPNFFFHASMAYAILRHNGVRLGKMDFIGGLPTQEG